MNLPMIAEEQDDADDKVIASGYKRSAIYLPRFAPGCLFIADPFENEDCQDDEEELWIIGRDKLVEFTNDGRLKKTSMICAPMSIQCEILSSYFVVIEEAHE